MSQRIGPGHHRRGLSIGKSTKGKRYNCAEGSSQDKVLIWVCKEMSYFSFHGKSYLGFHGRHIRVFRESHFRFELRTLKNVRLRWDSIRNNKDSQVIFWKWQYEEIILSIFGKLNYYFGHFFQFMVSIFIKSNEVCCCYNSPKCPDHARRTLDEQHTR